MNLPSLHPPFRHQPLPGSHGLPRALCLSLALALPAWAQTPRSMAPAAAAVSATLAATPTAEVTGKPPRVASEMAAATTRALALLADAAAVPAPRGARVQTLPGSLDSRLKLAPCARVEPFLVPGAAAWGRTRVGLRCAEGAARWTAFLPVTVQVWAQAAVPATALPGGTRLQAEHLQMLEVDWGAHAQPPFADGSALAGRQLARGVMPGQALLPSDLQARQWFAAGETVRVVASGPGFSVSADGQALGAGIEGQRVRVRIGENRQVEGRAVAQRVVEVGP